MLLSEAILLGSTMMKPLRGHIYEQSAQGEEHGCALGMAFKALGYLSKLPYGVPGGSPLWTTLLQPTKFPCGCHSHKYLPLQDVIAHLFDFHVVLNDCIPPVIMISGHFLPVTITPTTPWTLEQLVDWVRSQESQSQVESTITEEAKETVCSV